MKPLTIENLYQVAGGKGKPVSETDLFDEPVMIRGCCTQGCCGEEQKSLDNSN